MNVLVECDRSPALGHLDQVITPEQPPDEQRIAEHRRAHIMREPQPSQRIMPFSHQIFDDLQQCPRRVVAQQHVESFDHFVAQRLQRREPLLHRRDSGLERIEQPEHRPGHAHRARLGQLPDSARMQINRKFRRTPSTGAPGGERFVHRVQQFTVGRVKQKTVDFSFHALVADAPVRFH